MTQPIDIQNLRRAEKLQAKIPALNEVLPYPCLCKNTAPRRLSGLIQHLNDAHHPVRTTNPALGDPWTRERIADWLDTLGLDLTIKEK